MRRLLIGLALGASSLAPAQSPPSRSSALATSSQAEFDRLGADLGYRFTIVDNRPKICPGPGACFVSEIVITTPERLPPALGGEGLEIRYGFVGRVLRADSDVFTNRLVNGDLNALSLRPGKTLQPGRTYRVRLIGEGHFFSRYYPMPNVHLVAPGLQPRVVAATRPTVDPDTGLEMLPFVSPMTDEALATALPQDRTRWLTPERAFALYAERGGPTTPDIAILPAPVKASRPAGAPLALSAGVRVTMRGVTRAQLAPALDALAASGVGRGRVPLSIAVSASDLKPEGYRLSVDASGVRIEAGDAAGASFALRSLAQQAAYEGGRMRPLLVEDAPDLAFRGLHIDVARNFHSKAEILKLVEQMARYKFNKLHLHLGDDEGWRMEVKALPELTEVGAYRCYDATERTCIQPQLGADPDRAAPTNGFLGQADYLDILRAAKARQIEVIPSFDMPGHSRAAIRSMEVRYQRLTAAGRRAEAERYRLVEPGDTTRYRSIQNYDDNTLNVCLESTYRFLDTVIDELAALHVQAGTPLKIYHIGADETAGAWTESPTCKAVMAGEKLEPKQLGARFIERVAADLSRRGIKVAGWSDGLGHTDTARMPRAVQSNIWGGLHTGGVPEAHEQANRGWDIVLSMPDFGYLDMPYAPDPNEPGYDWATRGLDTFQTFAFMPTNLPANASLVPNILAQPATLGDTVPLQPGRRIIGLQAQLWSETVRSDAQVDYKFFPRLLGLAERGWRHAAWTPAYVPGTGYRVGDGKVDRAAVLAQWRDFAGRVGVEMKTLDRAGIAYRLAPPGARITDGRLEANAEFPGVGIEYRVGTGAWRRYTGPVAVNGAVGLRTRTPDGRRASRTVTVGAAR